MGRLIVMTEARDMRNLDSIRDRATISATELGALLNLDMDSTRKALRNGELPAFKVGGLWRIPVPKLLALLEG
jgi:excisionase family DNA binding protein